MRYRGMIVGDPAMTDNYLRSKRMDWMEQAVERLKEELDAMTQDRDGLETAIRDAIKKLDAIAGELEDALR